jgi:hypothetical protein
LSGQLSSGEALLTGSGAAATVTDAVRAYTVPRHPNEQRPVVAIVRRHVPSDRVPLFPVRQASDVSRHRLRLR